MTFSSETDASIGLVAVYRYPRLDSCCGAKRLKGFIQIGFLLLNLLRLLRHKNQWNKSVRLSMAVGSSLSTPTEPCSFLSFFHAGRECALVFSLLPLKDIMSLLIIRF